MVCAIRAPGNTRDAQKAIRRKDCGVFVDSCSLQQRAVWDKSVGEYVDKLKAHGTQFVTLDKKRLHDATAPIRAKYGSEYAELIKRIKAVK